MSRRAPGEGSIAQRPNGLWSAALQVNGKRQYVYGKTEAEARKKLADLKRTAAVQNGLPTSGTRTVSDLLAAWISNVSGTLKPRTVAEYEETSDRYVRQAIGKVRLSRLEPGLIQALYVTLLSKSGKRAPAKVHATLHRAFRLVVLWRWLSENPCDRVIRPKYRPERKEVWTAEQLRAFLSGTVGDRLHPFCMLAVTTGCRCGELVGAQWTDVDTQAGTISIHRNVDREVVLARHHPDGTGPLKELLDRLLEVEVGHWLTGARRDHPGDESVGLLARVEEEPLIQ